MMLSNCSAGEDSWESLDQKEVQQSILKEISPKYSLEELMLKLKLQYFGHLMRRADSLERTLMLGKIEDRRRRGQHMVEWHHWFNGHEFEQNPRESEGRRSLACCSPWGCRVGHKWATEQQNFPKGTQLENEDLGVKARLIPKSEPFPTLLSCLLIYWSAY